MISFSFGTKSIELELLQAESQLRRIEAAAGGRKTTVRLLDAIAGWLADMGLVGCTRSAAWQFLWAVYGRIERLRDLHATNADIAFWFGVDPFRLGEDERAGLLFNMGRVHAQSILHHGNYSATDYENIHRLTLLATGDEEQARQARATALDAYVDAKIAKKGRP